MNPQILSRCAARELRLGVALAGFLFVWISPAHAQAPVITNPGNLRTVNVNTAIRPLDSEPHWVAMAPMPTARSGFATAAAAGRVFAIGGAVINNCATIAVNEAYDPVADLWTSGGLAPLPPPLRFRPAGATLDEIIYVVGGLSTEDGCPGQVLGTVQAYDPATNTWSDRASLGTPRLQVGLGPDPANNLLYAVGGAKIDFVALDTVEVYDPSTDSWTTKQHLNTPRGFPAVAAVNGKIYAIGGQKEDRGVIDSVEEFDPQANVWITKPSMMPHPRLNSAAAVLNGKVYIIGGEAATGGLIPTVDVYDPSLDTWTTKTPMPTGRRVLGAAAVNDTIYAVGGEALVARVGEKFNYQITATNSPIGYNAFPLPPGLSIDRQRGIIFGIPTEATTSFVMTFEARNGSGSGSKVVSLFITPPVVPETASILAGTCVTGRAGQPFAFQVLKANASSEANLLATGLPYESGVGLQLILDPGTGFISGSVPSEVDGPAKSFGIQLGLTDAISAQSYLQLTFVSDPAFPVVTSGSKATLVLNQFFSYTITADAPTTSRDYLGLDDVLDGELPPGLSFDPSSGTISGTYTGETIKKEPPPRILNLVRGDRGDTGTAPLDFIIGLHDFEAEILGTETSGGTDYAIFTDDPLASGVGAGLLKSTQVGDFVTYNVPVKKSGSYDVKVGIRTGDSEGIFQLAIDDVNQGTPQDDYAPTTAYEVRDLGPVTFDSAGDKAFRFSITGKNSNSNGYEFVCDYIDLDPNFEAEALSVQEHSAPYTTIRDPELSGGAGTLFGASRVGDYITYTVPIATSGFYNLSLKTKPAGGTAGFQLFLDGVRQGYAQKAEDDRSGDANGLHDLGAVKFESAGDKAFQFLITERGRKGDGYDVLFDDIRLVAATHLEAEALPVRAEESLERVEDENLSGQAGILFDPEAAGSAVSYQVKIPVVGTYDVKIGIRTGNKGGIFQLSIDDIDQGTAQDSYSPGVGYAVLDLGRVTFLESGTRTFQFVVTGQNEKSKGFEFLLDYVDLVR